MQLLPNFLLIDLDDTIINYSAAGDQCWKDLCIFFAHQLGNVNSDELMSAINQSRQWFWSDPERHRRGRLNLISSRREIVAMAFDQLNIVNHKISQELIYSQPSAKNRPNLFPDLSRRFTNYGTGEFAWG